MGIPTTGRTLFTSESVSEGHPDKICDQISDAILDAFLTQDPAARVACEVTVTTGMVFICGEITSSTYVDIPLVVRNTIREIGYTGDSSGGFDADTCAVMVSIDEQSPDIAGGVDTAKESRDKTSQEDMDIVGAGDQGLMFGFACNETDNLMPLPIEMSHALVKKMATLRKNGTLGYLRPDSKSQVTIEYQDGQPARVDTIVISTQHNPEIGDITDNQGVQDKIEADIRTQVVDPVITAYGVTADGNTRYFINPSGRFVVGGPQGDAGLTGRKIIVDTYGGYSRHGGGAFSGKDPTKVDRSAAYAARYVAKNLVAAGLAEKCEVQVSYAIGMARPVSITVDSFGTGRIGDEDLSKLVSQHFDLRPAAIIKQFRLRDLPQEQGGTFYKHLAAYGHIGRSDLEVPWEATDKVDTLKQATQQVASCSL